MDDVIKIKAIKSAVFVVIALLSIFLVAPKASNPETYRSTIQKLNKKQQTVLEMTGTASATSLAIAAIPGDATTPIANKIIDLVGYFIIILCVIVMEKFFLTIAGYLTFTWLIPIALGLFVLNEFLLNSVIRQLAVKILAFGVCIVLLVPLSVRLSDFIEKSNDVSSKLESIQKIEKEVEESTKTNDAGQTGQSKQEKDKKDKKQNDKNIFDYITDMKSGIDELVDDTREKIEETGSSFVQLSEEAIKEARETMNEMVEVIVIMLVSTCGIPILTVCMLWWLVKLFLGIDVDKLLGDIKAKKQL